MGVREILEKLVFRGQGSVECGISVNEALYLLKSEVEKLKKDRYLTHNKLEYQIAWMDGHRKAIDEVLDLLST